jgi:hypothetical protein
MKCGLLLCHSSRSRVFLRLKIGSEELHDPPMSWLNCPSIPFSQTNTLSEEKLLASSQLVTSPLKESTGLPDNVGEDTSLFSKNLFSQGLLNALPPDSDALESALSSFCVNTPGSQDLFQFSFADFSSNIFDFRSDASTALTESVKTSVLTLEKSLEAQLSLGDPELPAIATLFDFSNLDHHFTTSPVDWEIPDMLLNAGDLSGKRSCEEDASEPKKQRLRNDSGFEELF